MSGIYWSLTAFSIIHTPNETEVQMKLNHPPETSIVSFVMDCYDPESGGFGGNIGHDAHLLYTLSAIQILALSDRLELLDKEKVIEFVGKLQNDDGSFSGDEWGEVDTRFSYCALAALSILGVLHQEESNQTIKIDFNKTTEYILSCRNFDGGFGCIPGAESHAGQIFCCVGALAILGRLDSLGTEAADLLCWWLAERQCDSGGLNGRPEKQADVCYSWWILSALVILGRVDWINVGKLGAFILQCQDEEDGGIADRPGNMPDVFHTFFGISGLSLIGHFQHSEEKQEKSYRTIDPVYALPTDVVQRLGLTGQVMTTVKGTVDERLRMYQIYHRFNSL